MIITAAVCFLFVSCASRPLLPDEINFSQPTDLRSCDLPPSGQQELEISMIAVPDRNNRDSAASVKALAQMQGLEIGTAVQFDFLQSESIYADTITA